MIYSEKIHHLSGRKPSKHNINSAKDLKNLNCYTGSWPINKGTQQTNHTTHTPPRWPSGKASGSRAEYLQFESHLRQDFLRVESYQWLQNWHSSGCPARRLALQGQRWDWSARCKYTVTGWDGKFDLQLLSQRGSTSNCLSRSVPEIHSHVAGMLSNPTNQQQGCHWTFAKITENLHVCVPSHRKWTQKETESSERERWNRWKQNGSGQK